MRARLIVRIASVWTLAALALFCAGAAWGQPAAGEAVGPVPMVRYDTVRVSNVFFETDLLQALSDISAQTGVQIITDGAVTGMVTAELRFTPLEDALARLLYPLGYSFRQVGDYYVVGTVRPDGSAFRLLASSEVLRLNYIRAADAAKLLADAYAPYVKVVPETNTLVVTAPPEIIRAVRRDLAGIDVPKRQVTIEATVLEVSNEAGRSLGLDWSGTLISGTDTLLRAITGIGGIADTTLSLVIKKLTGRLGGLSFTMLPSVQAMVQDGKVQIKANPRIVTADGLPADIAVGKEQYYQLLYSGGAYPTYRLEKIEYGVSLTITPYVANNGDITVYAEPRVSDVVGSGPDNLPIISKRAARTRVVVKDGESFVIGGLVMRHEQLQQRRIPLLGSIPIIGFFFSNTRKLVTNNEVVIIITPRLT